MKILKSQEFTTHSALVIFVQDNNIAREDIFTIKCTGDSVFEKFTIFFYSDSEIKEKDRNIWGNLKD